MRWGTLGDVAFEVSYDRVFSVNSATFEQEYRYAQHQIIKGKSKLQWMGKQLIKANIKGILSDAFCKPKDEMDKLKEEASKKEPLTLVIGDWLVGMFVIEKIKETYKEMTAKGDIRLIEFELELMEYY